jgi:predicted transcriptional regulator
MADVKSIDPFVCGEPAVEISQATGRILKQRMKTADEGRVVPAEEGRQRIQQWLSKSSTTKTR